ncbi:MAG: AMP-binding protein, partial [bacterium]|nr:AMP-binding protein [bacterium]
MKPTERKPRRSFRPSAKKRELLHQRLRESGFDAPADEHIPRRDDRGSAPLSFAQQRLWFLEQLQPDTAGYHLPLAVRITGELDPQVLERSLREIVRRHEVLRTSFPATDGEPVQHVLPPAPVQLAHVDVTALPAGVRARETTRLVTREVRRPFDLAHGPLLRTVLVRLADGEHAVLFNFHHIVVDGWSMGVFLRELTALYPAPASGRGSPLPELPIQYADFAAWQRGHLRGEVLEGHLAYWRRQLAAVPPVLDLVADRPRPAVFSLRGASCPLMVPAELTAAAEAVARTIEATPFMTLLAVFATLLWRSTGQSDLVVGSPVANRGRAELEPLIGFFVNTLALRVDLAPRDKTAREPSFHELLERVKETALGAYAHQDLPFEKLVDDLQPDRDLSHTPLFQVMLVLQNAPADSAAGTGLGLRPLALATPVAKFDLTLEPEHWSGGIGGSLVYSTDLFDGTTAVRLAGRFLHLLEGAVAAPGQALGDLPLLAAAERQQVLAEWATAAASPPDPDGEPLLHRLFEAQADRTPEAEALVGRDERLTYRELEQRANQLAHHLRARGIGPEQRVGICLERSPAIAVAMLAVLKGGGAYVPLDPTLPPERLAFLIADAGVAVVISDRDRPALPASAADPVLLDADADAIASRSAARPRPTVGGRNLAYVIYTSGTTGQPKGVMVAHEDIARRTAAVAAVYGLGPRDRQLQFFALGFDALGEELYPVLATGGAVVFY